MNRTGKRQELSPRAPERFAELCAHQQRQLDTTLADVEFLCRHQSFVQAAHRFGELRRMLEDHLLAEERVLLPLLVQHTGDPGGVRPRMLEEHAQLATLIEATATAISQWDHRAFGDRVSELRKLLEVHHANEEAVLFPPLRAVVQTAADWRLLCFQAGVPA